MLRFGVGSCDSSRVMDSWAPGHTYVGNRKITPNITNLVVPGTWDDITETMISMVLPSLVAPLGIYWVPMNGTHWLCATNLASLPLGWLGCCTVRFPWEQGRVCLAVTEIANFSLLKARWACFAFHWYDYLAKVFVPSMGLEDVIAHTEGLTMCAISDSQQSLSLSNTEMSLMRKAVFQTEWPWMLLQSPKEAPVPLFKQNVVSLYLMRWLVYCLY